MTPDDLEDRSYSIKEVAKMFGVHAETVRLWLLGKQGVKMDGVKSKSGWEISKEEIIKHANTLYGGS